MIRVVHPGSRILDPDTDFLPCRIPDPGVKKALSTYKAKIIIILYTFLKFDNLN